MKLNNLSETYKVLEVLPINKSTLKAKVQFQVDPGNEIIACELHCNRIVPFLFSDVRRFDTHFVMDLLTAGLILGTLESLKVHHEVLIALSQYFMPRQSRNSHPVAALKDFLMSPRWDAWANAHPARKPNTSERGSQACGKKKA